MHRSESEASNEYIWVNGLRVHYVRAGSGMPLLLIHGLVGSARNWSHNIQALASDAAVYAIDLPNMGESDRMPGLDASLEANADRVAACMDALGLAQADVAGHSHGGAIAMMLAARHPGRVRRLVLFAPANPFCNLGRHLIRFYNSGLGKTMARLIPVLPNRLKATALGRMYGDPRRVKAGSLEGYIDGLAQPGTVDHVLRIVQRWYLDMGQLRTALKLIVDKPVLLVWGDRDRAVGLPSGQKLHQMLPQSQLIVIPGAGHIAFEELPDICNRTVRSWLAAPVAEAPSFTMRYSASGVRRLHTA